MRNLLVITHVFPPLLYPRSIQIHRLIAHLHPLGWHTTVLTAHPDSVWGNQDLELLKIYPTNYDLIRVSALDKKIWHRALLRYFPFLEEFPDAHVGWSMKAAQFAKNRLTKTDFDAVCSFGMPMSGHLIGLQLKRRWKIPWVAHFSDPWVDNPFKEHSRLSTSFNRRLERQVIELADTLIFVSRQTRDIVMAKFPSSWRNKARVIPHSFDSNLYPNIPPETKDKILFRSIGNFYGLRTPEPLFRAISLLKEMAPEISTQCIFELVGTPHPEIEKLRHIYQLESELSVKSRVSYLESLARMREADVLLLIDAPAKINPFLPSKLIDYLGAKRFILGITPTQGASADVIRRVKGTVVQPEDSKNIALAIIKYHQLFRQGKLNSWPHSPSILAPYTIENTTNQFIRVLESYRT